MPNFELQPVNNDFDTVDDELLANLIYDMPDTEINMTDQNMSMEPAITKQALAPQTQTPPLQKQPLQMLNPNYNTQFNTFNNPHIP